MYVTCHRLHHFLSLSSVLYVIFESQWEVITPVLSQLYIPLTLFLKRTSLPMLVKSNENAKRPKVVPTWEIKLWQLWPILKLATKQSILDVNIGILPTIARTTVTDKQKYIDVAKSALSGTIKCLRTRENACWKWTSYYWFRFLTSRLIEVIG